MKSDKNNRSYLVRAGQPADREPLYRLWQECFHDSDAFTDFYFDIYCPWNRVLLLEHEGVIRAMLHLNPYKQWVRGQLVDSWYIVGVATDEDFRHRGAMTALLRQTFREAADREMPFVYLMPADEAIYRPFQFAYIYAQRVEKGHLQECSVIDIPKVEKERVRPVTAIDINETGKGDLQAANILDDGAGEFYAIPLDVRQNPGALERDMNGQLQAAYDMYTYRDGDYYRRLQLENRADGGDLLLLYEEKERIGWVSYACEGRAELRELFCEPGREAQMRQWLSHYFRGMETEFLPVKPEGFFSEADGMQIMERPIIMGRITHLEKWMALFGQTDKDFSLTMEIEDQWIAMNRGIWRWESDGGKADFSPTEEEPDIRISIDGLMQWMTGYCSWQELASSGRLVILSKNREKCSAAMESIPRLRRILINEII